MPMSSQVPTLRLERPVFVIGGPRSGTTAVFERLAGVAGLFTIGVDARNAIEQMDVMHPASHDWSSNELGADAATPDVVAALAERYLSAAMDRDQRPATAAGNDSVRLVEKAVRHALRVPFLAAAFPDAQFVFVHRDPAAAISGMLDGWRSERFITYRDLPGWRGSKWSMPLVEGWRSYLTLPLPELVVHQWAAINTAMLNALEALPSERWCAVDRDEFLAAPNRTVAALCERFDLQWDRPFVAAKAGAAGSSLDAVAPPKHAYLTDEFAHVVAPIAARANTALAEHGVGAIDPVAQRAARPRQLADEQAGAVHEVLQQSSSSLVFSTYRHGSAVIVRPGSGDVLGMRQHSFDRPMGIAVGRGRVAIATHDRITQLELHAGLAERMSDTPVDACYVPSSTKVTGDVHAQEMAFALGELWFVSTKFSCLATIDRRHSFVPRWRPSFVSSLAPEDRCHLTGLAMKDGQPAYVTAAAMTDDPQGWRREKVGAGVVVEVESKGLVAHGLTMPHSPRWHDGRLWLLDSGNGTLCTVDTVNGLAEPIVRLPGFARGLAFVGPYAFVGVSLLRPEALAGLPLAKYDDEPQCGIWMIDTRRGEIVGRVRVSNEIAEVFDLQVLPGMVWPDVLDDDDPLISSAYLLPDRALERVRSNADTNL